MTVKERKKLWEIYRGSVRLACSFFTTGDFGVAKEIFYTASAPMQVIDNFEMYGDQLDEILGGYGIDRVKFVDYMQGGRYL